MNLRDRGAMTPEPSQTFTTVAASCSHILGPITGVPLPARRPRTAGIRTRTDPPGLCQPRPKRHDLRSIATGRPPHPQAGVHHAGTRALTTIVCNTPSVMHRASPAPG
ncbi:hypothetical protein RHA1_ro08673 (plasmid) [Rhodococcus jostii RHA1]|uniref:Uncharacterized protein n=1 Tax=Rhodococcus jostii (strain RHA1) TaxID=101510 RepID=Q0RYB9_RHOJR|nr:hypothetical protein RHA1_ro08673 [Rhodococcus jostii RHA1]